MLLRMEPKLRDRISQNQFGFKKGNSTDTAIFRILRTVENAANWQNFPVFLLLLDWKKCFDRIQFDALFDALYRFGVPDKFIEVIKVIYLRKQFFVRDAFGESTTQSQDSGLGQGDPLSCLLLNILTTVLLIDAEKDWKKTFEENCPNAMYFEQTSGFSHVLYCDDSNLLNNTAIGLRHMLHAIEAQALIYGLTLNFKKTFLLCLGAAGRPPLPNLLSLNGTKFLIKNIAKTLGFQLGGATASKTASLKARLDTMRKTMHRFKFIWQSNISKKKKLDKYHSLVSSKGFWGLHLLALGKEDFAKVERQHIRCLRRILKIPAAFVSRINNETVLKRAGLPSAKSIIRQKQYQLLGHILRLPKNDPLGFEHPDWKVCFKPTPNCLPTIPPGIKKRKGRPCLRWAELLLNEAVTRYPLYTRRAIFDLAQDRKRWRLATWNFSAS